MPINLSLPENKRLINFRAQIISKNYSPVVEILQEIKTKIVNNIKMNIRK